MAYHPEDTGYNARILALEATVAQLQHQIKAYAARGAQAAQQATQDINAPLRNDVRALTELSAFVRKVANIGTRWQKDHAFDTGNELYALQKEAESILRGLTA